MRGASWSNTHQPSTHTVTKIATGAVDATVRVAHPTPPPLPTSIPSDAPI